MTDLTDWIGRTTELNCWLDPWRAQALHATLDATDAVPEEGTVLSPGWHWAYFLDTVPSKELGPDGHPRRGGFMPPVPLPRRMWAGSRLEFLAPIALGESARRVSRVLGIEEKSGRSGQLCFVTVEHEIHGASGAAIRETQDIVYRDLVTGGSAAAPQSAPRDPQWQREWCFDSPRLFRYSAITFNSHRIHYDREYVTKEEGYPGLVVHGPLLATLMLELVRAHLPRPLRRFEFRAIAPVFDGQTIVACGKPDGDRVDLWISGESGALHMRGNVVLG